MTDEWAAWRQEAAGIEPVDWAKEGEELARENAARAAKVNEEHGIVEGKVAEETVVYREQGGETADPSIPRAELVVVAAPQQHLVVGVGALAAMDDAAFEKNLAALQKGQDRLQVLTDKLLVKGTDYGTVPGIKKPFLQKPGAEKLANFYGLAVRFEADRVEGDGVKAPPLAYHVRAYVHLGSFDGPVVAQGYGEANSWEERYRYREGQRACPKCGGEFLMKGRDDSKLKGKWWCAHFKGGCNATFEASDPKITDQKIGKVDNPDPYGLANTLIKMGEKRAHVDAILRATGTSGFFTQDEDSPSVRQQSGDAAPDDAGDVPVENVTGQQEVERGGKPTKATPQQTAELAKLSKEKNLGPEGIARIITRVFDVPVVLPDGTRGEQGKWLMGYIEQGLTADQLGQVLHAIKTGEVPAAKEEQA